MAGAWGEEEKDVERKTNPSKNEASYRAGIYTLTGSMTRERVSFPTIG